MKNFYFLSCIGFLIWMISCQNVSGNVNPEILTAEYSLKQYNEFEKGFQVFMVIKNKKKNTKIKYIILNNRKFDKIETYDMEQKTYFIDQFFPLESMRIQNFSPPESDSRVDGIIFEIEGEEFFKSVNFKLK